MAGSGGASYQADTDILEALKRIIRVGVVQSYDPETQMARVKFDDKGGIKPAPLKCIARPQKPGAWVLCVFMPGGGGDGYVIGEV